MKLTGPWDVPKWQLAAAPDCSAAESGALHCGHFGTGSQDCRSHTTICVRHKENDMLPHYCLLCAVIHGFSWSRSVEDEEHI